MFLKSGGSVNLSFEKPHIPSYSELSDRFKSAILDARRFNLSRGSLQGLEFIRSNEDFWDYTMESEKTLNKINH